MFNFCLKILPDALKSLFCLKENDEIRDKANLGRSGAICDGA